MKMEFSEEISDIAGMAESAVTCYDLVSIVQLNRIPRSLGLFTKAFLRSDTSLIRGNLNCVSSEQPMCFVHSQVPDDRAGI